MEWLENWKKHNEKSFISSEEIYSHRINIYSPRKEHLNQENYIGLGKDYMIPWINRHTDTSIRVDEDGFFESKSTEIQILQETTYVSNMHDIVLLRDKEKLLVDTSHHERDSYSWILARNGISDIKRYAEAIYEQSIQCIVEHNKEYALIINSRWSSTNYYHWIHENLPRLKITKEKFGSFKDFCLIWIGNQPPLKYHQETMAMLGIRLEDITFKNNCLAVNRLVHSTFCHPGSFNKEQIKQIKEITSTKANHTDDNKKLIIMRRKGAARELIRNKTVNDLIEKYGFETVMLENLTIEKQVKLMHSARIVIAPHGAGLTNCVYMRKGCSLIEIMPSDSIHPLYWYLASLSELKYSMMPINVKGKHRQELEITKELTYDILGEHGIKI
tara:strand:- start:243 stop:1403 length:1161 start_codon:yes stop_codon:yes gene_type:complete